MVRLKAFKSRFLSRTLEQKRERVLFVCLFLNTIGLLHGEESFSKLGTEMQALL